MHVGIKIGIAAASAGLAGGFGGKVIGADGDNRLAGLGIAAAGAGIGSAGLLMSGAPKWSPVVAVAAAGVGYLLGATLLGGGAGEGAKNLAPGRPKGDSNWEETFDRSGIGKPFMLPERDKVETDPRA
jgi:hypothetical protein